MHELENASLPLADAVQSQGTHTAASALLTPCWTPQCTEQAVPLQMGAPFLPLRDVQSGLQDSLQPLSWQKGPSGR